MDISVIICTFNRRKNLEECVAHVMAQRSLQGRAWEIVLVDNNSTDGTREAVRKLEERYGSRILYVFEGNQGLSHARNRGIRATDSRYVAFIDDDILVAPDWLGAIVEAFETTGADAVGGCIHVQSPTPLPAWILPEMYGFLGHRDFGPEPFFMDGVTQFPFGGNMAFSRRMIDRVGLFDTRMGRKGTGLRREELFKGEETDYFQRIVSEGGRIYYEPRAAVHHKILPHQLRKAFFRTLHFNAGYQKGVLDPDDYGRRVLGVPAFIFRQTLRAAARYVYQLAAMGPSRAFRQQMTVGYFVGMIFGYRDRARNRNALRAAAPDAGKDDGS